MKATSNHIFGCGLGLSIMILCNEACKQPFVPPVSEHSNSMLVIDGFLNAGNDSTIITLSLTRNLGDTVTNVPELNAQINVVSSAGETFSLIELGNGVYAHNGLNMNLSENYNLQIFRSNGKKYVSDDIQVLSTPTIDSISWKQDTTSSDNKRGLTVYANTHDPENKTWYYQWEYEETWEYHAALFSFYYFNGSFPVFRTPDQYIYACFRDFRSTDLQIASSAKLSQDIIFEKPLVFIPQGDEKLSVRYSIQAKQYAITKTAYEYWENLKKNTELTGSIFDPQPSLLSGNIHCVTDPEEPALGYISASTTQTRRIFINNSQTEHWGYAVPGLCEQILITDFDQYFRIRGYVPLYPQMTAPGGFWATLASCADCTLHGGTLKVPAFW